MSIPTTFACAVSHRGDCHTCSWSQRLAGASFLPSEASPRIGCRWAITPLTAAIWVWNGDIDVFFLGALEIPRRKKQLKLLRREGVDVVAKGSWFDPACWGESRTRLLNRTKIFLNIQRYPGELSHYRLIMGGANRALIISEPMYNPSPYVPGKHYVSAAIKEMPEAIRYYLSHDDERKHIVEEAHGFVTQEMTAARSVSRILALINDHPKGVLVTA